MTRWLHFRLCLPRVAAVMLPILMAACAAQPPLPAPGTVAPSAWAARSAALLALHDWTLTGRVAVRDARQAVSGNVHWVQRHDAYKVLIFGPVGGEMQLEGDRRGGVLRLPHETDRSGDMEQLLQRRLGWRIPVLGLRYWARGVPIPGVPVRDAFDGRGRLAWLEQYGWRVVYRGYAAAGGLELPRRIDITQADLRVRLLVDQWDLNLQ